MVSHCRTPLGRGAMLRALLWLAILGLQPVRAHDLEVPAVGARDVCPVCGMFVAKYPEWVATLVFKDGQAVHFDGPKDLFKYLFDLGKYAPGRDRDSIAAMAVTEYYDLRRIDARTAWYVVGSDVLGPMGHEPVPLASAEDALAFRADHGGVRVLRFDEVDPQLLQGLDTGPGPRP